VTAKAGAGDAWRNRESPSGGAFIGNGQCCLDWSALMRSSFPGLLSPMPVSVAKIVIVSPVLVQLCDCSLRMAVE